MKPRRGSWPERKRGLDDFIVRVLGWGELDGEIRGFSVRFPRTWGIKPSYFATKKYGGVESTLKRARLYRDSIVRSVGAPSLRETRGPRRAMPFRLTTAGKNKSGMLGVCYDKKGGYWVAYVQVRPNKQQARMWSVKKYTNDGAKMLAINWRAEMISKLRRKK